MASEAYVVAGPLEEGIEEARASAQKELGLTGEANPDLFLFQYGLFSVEEARAVIALAYQSPLGKQKAIIISAARLYHEAQNALLKLFEEPPQDTTLYVVVPSLGQLLPTLRSRVSVLKTNEVRSLRFGPAHDFVKKGAEARSAYIKKLTEGSDAERRENRDEALALVNGLEELAYKQGIEKNAEFLRELALFRSYLHERAAPLRMILEHISLTLPKGLQ